MKIIYLSTLLATTLISLPIVATPVNSTQVFLENQNFPSVYKVLLKTIRSTLFSLMVYSFSNASLIIINDCYINCLKLLNMSDEYDTKLEKEEYHDRKFISQLITAAIIISYYTKI